MLLKAGDGANMVVEDVSFCLVLFAAAKSDKKHMCSELFRYSLVKTRRSATQMNNMTI